MDENKLVAALLTNAFYASWLVEIQQHGVHMDVQKLHALREKVLAEYELMQKMLK
ncbi:MAG TPA: hypothetical protein VMB78_03520 [Dissulfurispiraceae bacterium]|nr:hypothetical protein [Dissulfurispiraceae bacterium]